MSQIAMNADLAQIYRKATDGEELGPVESVRYTAYLSAFFAFIEEFHLLHRSGVYEEDLGDGDAIEFFAPTVRRLLDVLSRFAGGWKSREIYMFLSSATA